MKTLRGMGCLLWAAAGWFTAAIAGPSSVQFQFEQLKSFGFSGQSGLAPRGLTRGSDGKWYGTTRGGGLYDEWGNSYGSGTVFRLNPDGSGYTNLHVFSRAVGEGFGPYARLIEGKDGMLYGTTHAGGAPDDSTVGGGTIFRINKDGGGYTIIHRFPRAHDDGSEPYAELLEGSDGFLYGTTRNGGNRSGPPEGRGTLFRIGKDGAGHTVLHRFAGGGDDGQWPETALIEGTDGALYGTTGYGGFAGSGGRGVAFKIDKNGGAFTVLWRFTYADGLSPSALLEGSEGALYGTAHHGGRSSNTNNVSDPASGMGVVFRLQKDGSEYAVIHRFSDVNGEGRRPNAALLEGQDGLLYGTTSEGGTRNERGDQYYTGTVFGLDKDGRNYRILASMLQTVGDGFGGPYAPLVDGGDGALYSAYGTAVFTVNQDGTGFRELHRFSYSGGDGRFPAPLVEGSDGALYGATATHRARGGGTIFAINKDGSGYRILRVIEGPGFEADESYFDSNTFALLEGRDGTLYGTMKNTDYTGAAFVFRLNKDGTGFAKLHSFDYTGEAHETLELMQGSDGALYGTVLGEIFRLSVDGTGYEVLHTTLVGIGPVGVLTEASDGALYGIAFVAGYRTGAAVFRLNKDGSGYAVLQSLMQSVGGLPWQVPRAPLVEAHDGTLFGATTFQSADSAGAVFQLNKDGSNYKVLFDLEGSLGSIASDGAVYGTTPFGGPDGRGSIFRFSQDGSGSAEVFSFNGRNGERPARLLQGRDGALYGTTLWGGHLNLGTIFALRPKPVFLPPALADQGLTLRLTSMPNSTHRLQRASSLDGNWQTVTTMVIPATGLAEFIDPNASQDGAFYRTTTP